MCFAFLLLFLEYLIFVEFYLFKDLLVQIKVLVLFDKFYQGLENSVEAFRFL